jgi:hypothetical protein
LGLIDDVDCAVLSLKFETSSTALQVQHVASIPAFAYVATGISCLDATNAFAC